MRTKPPATVVLLLLTCVLQTGCALQQPIFDDSRSEHAAPPNGSERPVTPLLFYSRAVMQASPAGRLALLESAKTAYAENPTPATAARLALSYGQPDYTGYAPENGWRYAQRALAADDDYWGAAAVAYLRQFAALCVDNDHIRAQWNKAVEQTQSTRQQLARTRRALARAQRKLHALTRIETQLSP